MRFLLGGWFLLLAGTLAGQTFNNQTLNGRYYFRHLQFATDSGGSITDIRSLSGTLNFTGTGNFSFNGQQTAGANPPLALVGNGTYSVSPAGIVTLNNPQNTSLTLNARYGSAGSQEGMLVGSTTESTSATFDLFVALQAATSATSNASLNAGYYVSTLAFPSGQSAPVRNTLFPLQGNGQGMFSAINVSGHAANISNGAPASQTVTGATYAMNADGTGTATFPLQAGNTPPTQLLSGNETIYVSNNGNIILGGSRDPGVHDLLVGFKSASGLTFRDRFWHAGLRFDTSGFVNAYSGSLFSTGTGTLTLTRREHQLQQGSAIKYDFTGVNSYTLAANGSGTIELARTGLGAGGSGFVGSAIDSNDPTGYELLVGVRMPPVSGATLFLNPQGILSAASFAPSGASIAPGEFIALFGSGFASAPQTAQPPYPLGLGGITVLINNLLAPVQYISATQINAIVPYGVTGPTAAIVVNKTGQASNEVRVPVSTTAPGVFSLDQDGIGVGAILHTDFSLVSQANPARRNQNVFVYLAGLGSVTPAVNDGTGAPATPASRAVAQVNVLIGGIPAAVSFAGLAPVFPGVYLLNVTVPADLVVTSTRAFSLAVQTADSFHDMVDIIVSP
jgi:uncharacterized protein (TIGR03437 family)